MPDTSTARAKIERAVVPPRREAANEAAPPDRGTRADQGDGVLRTLGKLVALLSPAAKRNSAILLGLMIVGAVLEVVGLAAIPAFVTAIMRPDDLARLPLVGNLLEGFQTLDSGTLVIGSAVALIVIFGIKNGFLVGNSYLQARFVTNRRIDLGRRLTNAYMHAPYPFHLARNTSEMLRNIDREVNVIAYQVLVAVLEICTRGFILAGVLAFLFLVEPWITLFWLAIFGTVAVGAVRSVSAKLKRYGLEEQAQRKHFVQSLYQGFGSVKESRVLNREGYFADRINRSIERMAAVFGFKLFTGKAVSPVTEFVAVSGLLILAAALILLGRPTESVLVTLSLFVVGLVRVRETISAVMTHLANLRYNVVSILPVYADLTDLEARPRPPEPTRQPPEPRRVTREIALRDVWYRYDRTENPALRGIDLTIPAGSAVGFVGSTGAGKSTLIDILLGLLEPERGGVFVDGENVHEAGITSWQTCIGYVPQSIYLLDDSIRRNIALGIEDSEVDEAALWTAIRTAQLEAFVARQPAGLETGIGEHGLRLSGGERQRIGIARALYHNPQVLVLDEATSSLDNATERAVIAAVEALKGRRTIIMIAHRLTTVRNCDRLYFLKDGRIEAAGDYAELERQHPEFRLMSAV